MWRKVNARRRSSGAAPWPCPPPPRQRPPPTRQQRRAWPKKAPRTACAQSAAAAPAWARLSQTPESGSSRWRSTLAQHASDAHRSRVARLLARDGRGRGRLRHHRRGAVSLGDARSLCRGAEARLSRRSKAKARGLALRLQRPMALTSSLRGCSTWAVSSASAGTSPSAGTSSRPARRSSAHSSAARRSSALKRGERGVGLVRA